MKALVALFMCALLAFFLCGEPESSFTVPIDAASMPVSAPETNDPSDAPAEEAHPPEEAPIDEAYSKQLVDALEPIIARVREERRYILAKSSIASLSQADIHNLLPYELTRAWQEIYARHGKAEDPWFESRPWFSPRKSFRERDLSKIERANVEMLKKAATKEQSYFAPLNKNITKNGTSQVEIDLDGDGEKETLTTGYDQSSGLITMLCGNVNANLSGLSGDGLIYSVRWRETDKTPILLAPTLIDRELVTVHLIFRDGAFIRLGKTAGGIDCLKWKGDGTFLSQKTVKSPCEYTYALNYTVKDDKLEEIPTLLAKINVPVSLKTTLTLMREPGGDRQITFTAGDTATLVAASQDGWYALLASDNASIGWFRLAPDGTTIVESQRDIQATFKWMPL